jgi:hypothetical protein
VHAQNVVQGDDAQHAPLVVHDRHPAHAMRGHALQGFGVVLGCRGDDELRGHDLAHFGLVGIAPFRHDFQHDVTIRDDAHRLALLIGIVEDHEVAGVMLSHQPGRLSDGQLGRARCDVEHTEVFQFHDDSPLTFDCSDLGFK